MCLVCTKNGGVCPIAIFIYTGCRDACKCYASSLCTCTSSPLKAELLSTIQCAAHGVGEPAGNRYGTGLGTGPERENSVGPGAAPISFLAESRLGKAGSPSTGLTFRRYRFRYQARLAGRNPSNISTGSGNLPPGAYEGGSEVRASHCSRPVP